MVCGRMGMLDDAIREHLELKRLRGADPGEVARDEHEALGPISDEDADAPVAPDEAGTASAGPEVEQASWSDERPTSPAAAGSPLSDETAEIDMYAVLGSEARSPGSRGAEGRAQLDSESSRAVGTDEDSLEWEMPAASAANFDERADHLEDAASAGEEDMLEDTPDFLRDNPDQERLWFEQRAPRDFDFKE
jgi:hypothetical protein